MTEMALVQRIRHIVLNQMHRPRKAGADPQYLLIGKCHPTVIPACPESIRCGGKDSGQAGMTEMALVQRIHHTVHNQMHRPGRADVNPPHMTGHTKKKSGDLLGSPDRILLSYSASVLLQNYCTLAVTNPDLKDTGVDRIGGITFNLNLQLAPFND
jgi:hypothetical protein